MGVTVRAMRALGSLVPIAWSLALAACVAQPQPQPAYYPQAATPPAYGEPAAPGAQPAYGSSPGDGTGAPAAAPGAPDAARHITINGMAATARDFQTLAYLEQQWGGRLPSGHYWYDNATGAAGYWGGPMLEILPAGLQLGGPMPPNASGGGTGMITGVFINGRELHPQDVAQLQAMIGEVPAGRWWVDAQGNFGMEGGPVLGNLDAVARQHSGGRNGRAYSSTSRNGSVFVKGGCVSVTGSDGSTMSTGC
jgi:hypothetical protein